MDQNSHIDICLATFNGAKWIVEFLDSLVAQTHSNWRLVVSDDGSSDETIDIIKNYFADKKNNFYLVPRDKTGLGVVRNFQDALFVSQAEYVLLADQDDVWHPSKIKTLLLLMQRTERKNKKPTLVFSDLEVVDERLNTLDRSWWSYISIKPKWVMSLNAMLIQNIVPGCAMMINRSLLNFALPLPKCVVMHDWWFLLVALAFGNIVYCPDKLIQYRRHTEAFTYLGAGGFLDKLSRQYQGIGIVRSDYSKTVIQAQAFQHLLKNNFSSSANKSRALYCVTSYLEASRKGWLLKRILLFRMRVHLISFIQTLKFYLYI